MDCRWSDARFARNEQMELVLRRLLRGKPFVPNDSAVMSGVKSARAPLAQPRPAK
jgi:hypothetical protein